jgi:hypothetical protein
MALVVVTIELVFVLLELIAMEQVEQQELIERQVFQVKELVEQQGLVMMLEPSVKVMAVVTIKLVFVLELIAKEQVE